MRPRHIAMIVTTAASAAFCAFGPAAAEHRPPSREQVPAQAGAQARVRHNGQMDVNDVAGHGAWRGCAKPNAIAGKTEWARLAAISCGREPVFLASIAGGVAAGLGRVA